MSNVSGARDEVHLAIAYNRIIWRAARLTNPDMLPVDLNAEECLDVMERVAALYGRWHRRRPGACEPVPQARLISHYRMNAAALAHVEQVLTQRYHAALCSPSDMVGIVAQSIAEPSTQMVLNSVTWDTEADLHRRRADQDDHRGSSRTVHGEHGGTPDLEAHPQDTHWHGSRTVTSASAPSTRRAAHWTQVEACTRHPVVNEDGSNTVYKVTVRSGAEVTVTRGACSSASATRSCTPPWTTSASETTCPWPPPRSRTCEISTLDLIDWVSPTKAVYMSEAAKAIDFYHNGMSRSAANRTVKPATDTAQLVTLLHPRTGTPVVAPRPGDFTLPFKRADAFMASFNVAKSAVNNTRAA
jgi:hypothetical protein